MKNAQYRKHNDRSLNSSTYHKKDGTSIRSKLKDEIQKEIEEAGAEYSKQEDQFGDTKSGWWMDGVYLGKTVKDAIESIQG